MLVHHVNYRRNFHLNFAKFRKNLCRTPPDNCFCMERKVKHYSTWKNSVVSLQSNFIIIIILIIVIIIVIHLLKVD